MLIKIYSFTAYPLTYLIYSAKIAMLTIYTILITCLLYAVNINILL